MSPASGTPAIPTPAITDASTIVSWCAKERLYPNAWHRNTVAMAS
jgi:hypothetical protein